MATATLLNPERLNGKELKARCKERNLSIKYLLDAKMEENKRKAKSELKIYKNLLKTYETQLLNTPKSNSFKKKRVELERQITEAKNVIAVIEDFWSDKTFLARYRY